MRIAARTGEEEGADRCTYRHSRLLGVCEVWTKGKLVIHFFWCRTLSFINFRTFLLLFFSHTFFTMSVWEKIKQGTRDTAIATKLTAQKTAVMTEISIIKDKIKAHKQVGQCGVDLSPVFHCTTL